MMIDSRPAQVVRNDICNIDCNQAIFPSFERGGVGNSAKLASKPTHQEMLEVGAQLADRNIGRGRGGRNSPSALLRARLDFVLGDLVGLADLHGHHGSILQPIGYSAAQGIAIGDKGCRLCHIAEHRSGRGKGWVGFRPQRPQPASAPSLRL